MLMGCCLKVKMRGTELKKMLRGVVVKGKVAMCQCLGWMLQMSLRWKVLVKSTRLWVRSTTGTTTPPPLQWLRWGQRQRAESNGV